MWRHLWPLDIVNNLVSSTNREGTITKSDLKLAVIVLHRATLLPAVPGTRLAVPCSGPDNTLTVSWSTKEALTINLVVSDQLCICALHSRLFFINPSVFYHPGIKNHRADDASCNFDLSDSSLLAHMSATYPQPHNPWKISLPPPDLLSCVISTQHRKSLEQKLHKMLAIRSSTSSAATSVPSSQ